MELEDFQVKGVEDITTSLYFREKDFWLLGDEMGLGKTPQAVIASSNSEVPNPRIAVVCLANSRGIWLDHFNTWTNTCDEDFNVIYSSSDVVSNSRHAICSYGLAKDCLPTSKFDYIILDECHGLSDPKTKQTKALIEFVNRNVNVGAKVLGLSGTWPKNCPIELWPLLHEVGPGYFRRTSYRDYAKKFCNPWVHPETKEFIVSGFRNTDLLHRSLKRDVMTRRLVKNVKPEIELPNFLFINLDDYGAPSDLLCEEREMLSRFGKGKINIEGRFGKAPKLGDYARARKRSGIKKADAVVKYCKELLATKQKITVFCHSVDLAKKIEAELKKYGSVRITGEISPKKRDKIVADFQSNPDTRVFVGNINAAGVAITLTSAHDVVFAEASWVPGENDQVIGRCRRYGQTKKVDVHFLVVRDSLDEGILRKAYEKKQGTSLVLDGESL